MKKCEAIKCFQFQGLVFANSNGKLIGNKDFKESFNDGTDCQTELEKLRLCDWRKLGKKRENRICSSQIKIDYHKSSK